MAPARAARHGRVRQPPRHRPGVGARHPRRARLPAPAPRRRDLVWLSLGLVAGVIGQIVLGGFTVLFDLAPRFVMAHFLLSLVLVADAVVAAPPGRRSGRAAAVAGGRWCPTATPSPGRARRRRRRLRPVRRHRGHRRPGPTAATRRPPVRLAIRDVARLHGLAVVVFLGCSSWLRSGGCGAPRRRAEVLRRASRWLLAVSVAQAAVGYTQYFTDVPALLVGVHILGAVAVWIATLRLWLVVRARPRRREFGRRVCEWLARRLVP